MIEFAFDVQLQAVIRVNAATAEEASSIVASLQEVDWSIVEARNGLIADRLTNSLVELDEGNICLTEFSTVPESIHLIRDRR